MQNTVLEKFRKGEPTLGTFTHLKSMEAIEALGLTGLDYVVIDTEHCPVGISEAAKYLTAASAANITPLMRISAISRTAVLQALDAGAMGLIVPCVETVEQVRELVNWAKFSPLGQRGYCMTRDGQWGFGPSYAEGMEQYMTHSNNEALLLPQCETLGCLEHIEEITAMPGVDGIMVGPYDLSIALGMPADFTNPIFKAALERILQACKANGKLAMIFTGTAADARARLAQGYDSAIMGLDLLNLIGCYRQQVEAVFKEEA